jgi:hypothetical protein
VKVPAIVTLSAIGFLVSGQLRVLGQSEPARRRLGTGSGHRTHNSSRGPERKFEREPYPRRNREWAEYSIVQAAPD